VHTEGCVQEKDTELYGGSDQCTQSTHIGLHLVSQQYSKARTEYNGTIHIEPGGGSEIIMEVFTE